MSDSFASRLKSIRETRKLSQEELAEILGTSKQVISRYETNQRTPKITIAKEYANKLNVDLNYLLGIEAEELDIFSIPGIIPIETYKIPLLGSVSCGELKYEDEDFQGYVVLGADISADYAIRAKGDSMIGAFIRDGDLVFVKQQPVVDNGNIAVVSIDGEITLKRFKKVGNTVFLIPENSAYDIITVDLKNNSDVRILGKAVAFQSNAR